MKWPDLKADLMRLVWPLFILVLGAAYILGLGGALLRQQLGILAWKGVLVGFSVAFAHFVRIELFPYVDVSDALAEKTVAGSLQLLSMVVLYAVIILAVCSGL